MKNFFEKIAANGPLYTAGQIIGLALIIWNFFIYVQKSHEKILIFKCAGDLMSVVQFAFCGAYTGAALNVVMAFREIIFLNKTKHKWASGKIWLYVFIVLIFLSPFVTSKEPILSALWLLNVLPAFGSSLAVIGLYNEKTLITKMLSGIGIACWLVYVILLKNYIQIVGNVITLSSICIGITSELIRRKKGDEKETNEIICNRDIDTTVQNGEIDNEKRNEKRDSI